MQGGSARGVPLTAFTLLAFLDAEEGSQFTSSKNNAIDYLVRNIPTDPYQLSLVAYALAKANHPGAPGALARLSRMATEEGEMERRRGRGEERRGGYSVGSDRVGFILCSV